MWLWYRRHCGSVGGYFGKHLHKHPLLKGDEGKGDSGLCPLTHVEQINKNPPFPNPHYAMLNYFAWRQHVSGRRERWRGKNGSNGGRGGKRQRQRYIWKKGVSLWSWCRVTCANVVSIFTFSQIHVFLFLWSFFFFFYSTTALQFSPQKQYDEDANEVCIESKHVDWGFVFWPLATAKKTVRVFTSS